MGVYLGDKPVSLYLGGANPASIPVADYVKVSDPNYSTEGEAKNLVDGNGSAVFPVTKFDNVYDGEGTTLGNALDELSEADSAITTEINNIKKGTTEIPGTYAAATDAGTLELASESWVSVGTKENWNLEGYYSFNLDNATGVSGLDYTNDLVTLSPYDGTTYKWCLEHVLSLMPAGAAESAEIARKSIITDGQPQSILKFQVTTAKRRK